MTKVELNYTKNISCCKYCKHLRDINGVTFCSLMNISDNIVDVVDVCNSFKNIW